MKKEILLSCLLFSQLLYSGNLELEKSYSPYIKKYKDKSIFWYEYNNNIFDKAKKEKKMIFLSIGNNTCKWCDIQDKRVFDDYDASSLMNIYFIPVKIDQEQTPGIAKKYIDIYKLISKTKFEIPLNVILDSDGQIIYMKNFIPLDGKDGLLNLIPKLSRKLDLREFRKKIKKNNIKINKLLEENIHKKENKTVKGTMIISSFINMVKNKYDKELGGFKTLNNRKYNYEPIINTLIDFYIEDKNTKTKWIITNTLNSVVRYGLRDHVAGGFFSYTDSMWKIPVFKKELFQNAQVIFVLSKYIKNIEEDFEYIKAIKEAFSFIELELKDKKTGFYFTKEMEKRILVKKETEDEKEFLKRKEEEFSGKYYLFDKEIISEKANFNEKYVYINNLISQTEKERYLKIRSKKKKPEIDKRVFFSENSYFAKSLIYSRQFKKEGLKLLEKLIKEYKNNNGYIQHLIGSKKKIDYTLSDYVFFLDTLLMAYNETLELRYIKLAEEVFNKMEEMFYKDNLWYSTNSKIKVIATLKSRIYENSELSILFSSLNELYHLKNDLKYLNKKNNIIKGEFMDILYNPLNYSLVIRNFHTDLHKKYIIVSSIENIVKLKKIYNNKYYYVVSTNKNIILLKNNKKKIIANDINSFIDKEKKLIDKVRKGKFILFLD